MLGGKSIAIAGTPPKKRVIINAFDNMDAAVAAYNSPAFKEATKIGDKYATFRTLPSKDVDQALLMRLAA